MKQISFKQIFQSLDRAKFPQCQLVIGIAKGGIAPATLIAARIGCNLRIIRLNFRNSKNIPLYPKPRLISKTNLPKNIKSVLLVDDVSISGKTLSRAKELFKNKKVSTMVLRGKADYVLFPKIKHCVRWPWQI